MSGTFSSKKIIVVSTVFVAVLLLFFTFTILNIRNTSQKPRYGGTLRMDVLSPLTSLDPFQVKASGSTYIFPFLYSRLVDRVGNHTYEPDLAESWSVRQDGKVWHFVLKKGVRFHDGSIVRPRDVKHSILQAGHSFLPELKRVIDEISCAGDDQIIIHLKMVDPELLEKIWMVGIISSQPNAEHSSKHIGSGPFRFYSRDGQRQVVLRAFDQYHGRRPYIDEIIFSYVPDSDEVWYRLIYGQTDFAFRVSPDNVRRSRKAAQRFYFLKDNSSWVTMLLYNNRDPLFETSQVRRALTMALDRKYLIECYLEPDTQVATGYFFPDSPHHNPEVFPMPYQPEKSLNLLRENHWRDQDGDFFLDRQGKNFEFEILVPQGHQQEVKIAREIQLFFYELGVKVHLKILSMPRMIHEYLEPGRFQAAIIGLRGNEAFLEEDWKGKPRGAYNFGGYHNPRLDDILIHLREKKDQEERYKLYREIDRILIQDQPASFLYRKVYYSLLSRRVRNFKGKISAFGLAGNIGRSYLDTPHSE